MQLVFEDTDDPVVEQGNPEPARMPVPQRPEELVGHYDLTISHPEIEAVTYAAFERWLARAATRLGLSCALIHEGIVREAIRRLARGELSVGYHLDYHALWHRPDDPYARLAEAIQDAGGWPVNAPARSRAFTDKAAVHAELLRAGLGVPPTLIIRPAAADRPLTGDERAAPPSGRAGRPPLHQAGERLRRQGNFLCEWFGLRRLRPRPRRGPAIRSSGLVSCPARSALADTAMRRSSGANGVLARPGMPGRSDPVLVEPARSRLKPALLLPGRPGRYSPASSATDAGVRTGPGRSVRAGMVLDRTLPERRAGAEPVYGDRGRWPLPSRRSHRLSERPVRCGRAKPLARRSSR